MKTIGWIVTFIIASTVSYLLKGYALSVLWGWFIVDTFKLPSLDIPTAIGLSLIVSYLTQQAPAEDKSKDAKEVFIRGIAIGIIYPILALFTGWIITLFM